MRALQRFARLDSNHQRLLVEAVFSLARASFALRVLPFRIAIQSGLTASAGQCRTAHDVIATCAWSVATAARHVPWRAVCIHQAIALQHMLTRRGVDAILHYGVAMQKTKELKGHVWVSVAGQVVIGEEHSDEFSCLADFG